MSSQPRARADSQMREPVPPFPEQHQEGVGLERKLDPRPRYKAEGYRAAGKL